MRKIVLAAALIAGVSGHAQAQFQSNWSNNGQQNGYDATERMNEKSQDVATGRDQPESGSSVRWYRWHQLPASRFDLRILMKR